MTTRPKPYLFLASPANRPLPNDLRQWPNHVLSGSNARYHWAGAGPLSIKTFTGGAARYRVGRGGLCAVDDASYLVLNHDQTYEITIESPAPVTSFCLFFAEGFAETVRRGLTERAECLLDAPEARADSSLHFFERTYPSDDSLASLLSSLRLTLRSLPADDAPEPGWLEERMHRAMELLLARHRLSHDEAEALGPAAARPATREELYRRLHVARDFMAANYGEPLALGDIGRIACLSPNHLLRTFKALFGVTPHQYLVGQRLETARGLLERTDLSVTEVCLSVGFSSLGSFSRLFSRRVGISPDTYRRLAQTR
jgi:AraC family transcriptional regulator